MTKPVWQREGWKPAGPGQCRCPRCGRAMSTNALGRASHSAKHAEDDLSAFLTKTQLRDGDVLIVRGHRYTVVRLRRNHGGRQAISTVPDGSPTAVRNFTPYDLRDLGYTIERSRAEGGQQWQST